MKVGAPLQPVNGRDLDAMEREQLLALITVLTDTINELVVERDAARLLNELCHY